MKSQLASDSNTNQHQTSTVRHGMSVAEPLSAHHNGHVGQAWCRDIAKYKRSSLLRSSWQLTNSLLLFCGLWYLMYLSLAWSYLLTGVLAIPTAGLLVRLFIIQHDCGHYSFFSSRRANDLLGTFCSFFTLTPYRLWRRSHSRHHASSGNLGHRGHGDVWTLTVDEYQSRSYWGKLQYRFYRHPLFLFLVGPSLLFGLRQRFTLGIPATWRRERRSVHLTNFGIAAAVAVAWVSIGITPFLLVHVPVVAIASSMGAWLFFIQHQFETAYWQPDDRWDFARSACEGSSYYRLPVLLQWFTGNIGFHHIHHLESRIPNYNLPRCFADTPELRHSVTIGLWESVKCPRLKLWDEARQQLITFREANCART